MRSFNCGALPRPEIGELKEIRGPMDLEIGAGQGLHAIQYCLANPGRKLVALERTQNRFMQLKRRAQAHPAIRNLAVFRADAIPFVTHFVAKQSIQRVFLLYPNPYPKARQANLRWHRSAFMGHLREKMAASCTLHLATNLEWYAREAEHWFLNAHGLNLLSNRRIDVSDHPRTHFERKYLARGETCFDLIFEKGLH